MLRKTKYLRQHLNLFFQIKAKNLLNRIKMVNRIMLKNIRHRDVAILKIKCEVRWQLTHKYRTQKIPERLPGSIWGITTFFNPCGYKKNLENYHIFQKAIRKQNLPIITIELAFGDSPFVLKTGDADILVQRRGGNIMWQKERLLNVALDYLPKDCDKVVWLDSDILFEKKNWVEKTANQLEKYIVVQPFSHVVRLPKGKTRCNRHRCKNGSQENEIFHGFGLGMAKYGKESSCCFHVHGTTGIAWAIRRSILKKHGFYDADITGSGDVIMAHAFCGNTVCGRSKSMMCASQQKHAHKWAQGIAKDIKFSINYAEGIAFHLWHGNLKNRSYIERHNIAREAGLNPETDIAIDTSGAWKWASDKPKLHQTCASYFADRKEDG